MLRRRWKAEMIAYLDRARMWDDRLIAWRDQAADLVVTVWFADWSGAPVAGLGIAAGRTADGDLIVGVPSGHRFNTAAFAEDASGTLPNVVFWCAAGVPPPGPRPRRLLVPQPPTDLIPVPTVPAGTPGAAGSGAWRRPVRLPPELQRRSDGTT